MLKDGKTVWHGIMSEVTLLYNCMASTFILCKVPASTVDYHYIICIVIQHRIQYYIELTFVNELYSTYNDYPIGSI